MPIPKIKTHVKSHHPSTLVKRKYHPFNHQRIVKLAMAADALRVQGKITHSISLMVKCVKCIIQSEIRKAKRERAKNDSRR